jgi:hypothetical protein
MEPVDAPAGTSTRTFAAVFEMIAADVPLKATAVAVARLSPVIVTVDPSAPALGGEGRDSRCHRRGNASDRAVASVGEPQRFVGADGDQCRAGDPRAGEVGRNRSLHGHDPRHNRQPSARRHVGPSGPHLMCAAGPSGPCRPAPAGLTLALLLRHLGGTANQRGKAWDRCGKPAQCTSAQVRCYPDSASPR